MSPFRFGSSIFLMGRDLMNELEISLSGIQTEVKKLDLSNQNNELKVLLDKYAELFDGKLGTLKGRKIHFKVK